MLSTLTTITFGVVPLARELPAAPVQGFVVYDERVVRIEHLTAELSLGQPGEVAAYVTLFDRLAAVACYGADARVLIKRALAGLQTASQAASSAAPE